MSDHEFYVNPLCTRYSGEEMKRVFSDNSKFSTWRRLWVALAESERELGIPITEEQIAEMRGHINDIDYAAAAAHEHEVRHDVMAHVLTFGECCPKAKPIIHLGATSCYVGDNTDVILMREALNIIRARLINVAAALCTFAEENKNVPTLAYTHFQAAQPTTVGKRATLWLQDILMDLENIDFQIKNLKLLGCKGTTGTGASFLELFDGDAEKVKLLEKKIAEKMGFEACFAVSGQTYTRKLDFFVLQALSGIAQSASKFAGDIRLLSHLKEVDEPFEAKQIGSSAMAYKRNPMRRERIASLSRYVICDLTSPAVTASVTPNMMTAAIHIIVSGMFPLPPLNNRPISSARTAEPVRMPAPIHLLFGDRLVMKESKEANRLFFGGSGAAASGSGTAAGLCPSVCAAGASAANSSPMDTP